MKLLTAILISCFIVTHKSANLTNTSIEATKSKQVVQSTKKLDFEKDVLPVLVKNCSPCHFTGGKMYEKLPFDKEATIINNGDRILKRVEKDEKKSAIKEFILQNKKAGQA